MDKHIKDQLCADWCDVLSQYTLDEVRYGVRAVFAASKGKARSINEFQVQEQIRMAHRRMIDGLPKSAPNPEPERDNSPEAVERRRALSAELLGGAASSVVMPKPQSEAPPQANINAAKGQIGE